MLGMETKYQEKLAKVEQMKEKEILKYKKALNKRRNSKIYNQYWK